VNLLQLTGPPRCLACCTRVRESMIAHEWVDVVMLPTCIFSRNQLLRPVNSLRFASGVVENHRLQLRVRVLGSE